jgi:hypothetical protein
MKSIQTFLLLSALMTFSLCAIGQTIHSGTARAMEVAIDDLSQQLRVESKIKWQYSDYVSNISNYSFGISESKNFYVVVAKLNRTNVSIHGGGGIYYIDKNSFDIVRNIRNE